MHLLVQGGSAIWKTDFLTLYPIETPFKVLQTEQTLGHPVQAAFVKAA